MSIDGFLQGGHEVFRSEDGRWFITRSNVTGTFRLHDDLYGSQVYIGGMTDLRHLSDIAEMAYLTCHEQFVADLLALAEPDEQPDIIAFVPDEDVPF